MAISVNWITGEITVPRADMPIVQASPEIREHDVDAFRLELKDLEDDVDGIPWPDTHRHNTEVTLSGVVYARIVEIIAPYFVTYEDGQYAVNLVGANNNIPDVATVNQVSIRASNSAGLVRTEGIDQATLERVQRLLENRVTRGPVDGSSPNPTVPAGYERVTYYDDDGTTILREHDVKNAQGDGERQPL